MADRSDKTQAATPQAPPTGRQSGQVAHSQDVGSAVLLLGSLALMLVAGGALLTFLAEFLQASLGGQAWQADARHRIGSRVDRRPMARAVGHARPAAAAGCSAVPCCWHLACMVCRPVFCFCRSECCRTFRA